MQTINQTLAARAFFALITAALLLSACGTPAPTQSVTEAAAPTSGAAESTATFASPTHPSADPTTAPTAAQVAGPVSFARDLLPLFNETCIKCHGGDKIEKGLDMKSYSALMAGSERGAVVVPGDASSSRLAQLVENGKMPKRGPKLTSEQVQLIVDWINSGAQNN